MSVARSARKSGRRRRVAGAYLGVLYDLIRFLWARKLWWLVPILLALVIVGLLVVLASSGPASPFIYTLF